MKLTEKQVRRRVEIWQKILGLNDWEFSIKVVNDPSDVNPDAEDRRAIRPNRAHTQAEIMVHEGYLIAEIVVFAFNVDDLSGLERVIVHELVHVIIEPMRTALLCSMGPKFNKVTSNLIEAATERVAQSLIRLIQHIGQKAEAELKRTQKKKVKRGRS